MDQLFQEGIDQFVLYQKNMEGKKSRHEKRKQKIQKLKADMADPELRRERHRHRREVDKAKLQKQLQGMTEEQARVHLENKRQQKRLAKQRAVYGLEHGMPVLIDAVFEDRMNEKQNKSLAIQIELIMKAIKQLKQAPGIHLCSVAGRLKNQLSIMKSEYWIMSSNTEDIMQVAKRLNKKPVYLSPDATDELHEIDPEAAYVIGGLVDRTVIKNASMNRARELEIPAYRLPIRQFMTGRRCLNLDHVVMMLCKFKETKDWKTAFDYGAPKRWKKEDAKDKTGQAQKQSESQSDEDKQHQQKSQQSKQQSTQKQQLAQSPEPNPI